MESRDLGPHQPLAVLDHFQDGPENRFRSPARPSELASVLHEYQQGIQLDDASTALKAVIALSSERDRAEDLYRMEGLDKFPEAEQEAIARAIIAILSDRLTAVRRLGRRWKTLADLLPGGCEGFHAMLQEEAQVSGEWLERQIRKWAFRLAKTRGEEYATRATAERVPIEDVKAVPIETFVPGPWRRVSSRHSIACCPLHGEKTPSFTWYVEQNSWYCYGCAEGGSVIDLVMKLEKCGVGEAIKAIIGHI